ncbi:uncharacterized protein BDW70DRAFT_132919 [Aspergillus foveolatus]|uniref:uncharacterized protein n=1 Tax=Aspergillus foveolatus TaxID=210207 RepID=UPI003CCE0434
MSSTLSSCQAFNLLSMVYLNLSHLVIENFLQSLHPLFNLGLVLSILGSQNTVLLGKSSFKTLHLLLQRLDSFVVRRRGCLSGRNWELRCRRRVDDCALVRWRLRLFGELTLQCFQLLLGSLQLLLQYLFLLDHGVQLSLLGVDTTHKFPGTSLELFCELGTKVLRPLLGRAQLLGECFNLFLKGFTSRNGLVSLRFQLLQLLLQFFHLSWVHSVVFLENVLRPLLPVVPVLLQELHLFVLSLNGVLKLPDLGLEGRYLLNQFINASRLLSKGSLGLLKLATQSDTAFTENVKLVQRIHKFIVAQVSALTVSLGSTLLFKFETRIIKLGLSVVELLA